MEEEEETATASAATQDQPEVESKLRALLTLLNPESDAKNLQMPQVRNLKFIKETKCCIHIKKNQGPEALRCLSQLEEMARRLKDQLLMEQPQVCTYVPNRKILFCYILNFF